MRWLTRVLAVAALVGLGVAFSPAQAAFAACEGDPPIPARPEPYHPQVTSDGNPFSGDVSQQSVYGYMPQVWSYDNGCSPGSDIMPGVGASLANISFEFSGYLSGWTHALLEAVIAPDWAAPLDKPVTAATEAVARGTWTPYLTVALLLVGVVVLFRSRAGHVGGAITATVWALLVLVAVSWMISYPTEAIRTVDGTVRSAVVTIGDGFSGETASGGTAEDRALHTVDGQMDAIVSTVAYRTWSKAVFGDPESQVAKEYGPQVFEATHFSWKEWETYQADPDGAGEELREEKQDRFEELAGEIEDADPAAYEHFTGSDWGSRITQGVLALIVMAIVCAFLLLAGIIILAAFAVIRLVVPFSPGLGVLFLLDAARARAIDVFRRVGGLIVMGPVYFVASLVLLRFYAAILASSMPFLLQLTFIIAISVLAWQLLKPAAAALSPAARAAQSWVRHKRLRNAVSGRNRDDEEHQDGNQTTPQGGHTIASAAAAARRGPVYTDHTPAALPAGPGTADGTFVRRPGVVTVEEVDQDERVWHQPGPEKPGGALLPAREAWSMPGVRTAGALPRAREPWPMPAPTAGSSTTQLPVQNGVEAGAATVYTGSSEEAATPAVSSPATGGPDPRPESPVPYRSSKPSPVNVNESNLVVDEQGNRVFAVYTPPTDQSVEQPAKRPEQKGENR